MSERVATEAPHGAPTIGDILLRLGFVDQEGLDAAVERQQVTGQPIGQVLVEVGAITRLELATALAEQWADPSSPGPRWLDDPRSSGLPAPTDPLGSVASPTAPESVGLSPRVAALEAALVELRAADGGTYLSQLQDAVVELARRTAGSEAAATELAARVEGSSVALGRLRELDGEVADATQRLDAVAAGVEVAIRGLQGDVADVVDTVGELATRIDLLAAGSVDAAALEQLRAALEDLAARPAGDPALADRLADVVARVDELPASSELESLRAAVAELAERPPGDPALVDALDELRMAVAEHAGRPVGDPELGPRVEALSARLDELHDQLDVRAAETVRLSALQERLDGFAAELAVRDGDAEVLAEVAASVSELTGRVEALAAVAGASVDADAVEALKMALDELAGRSVADPAIESRIDALVEHVALLPDAHELQELRASLAELAARPAVDPNLAARLDELAAGVAHAPAEAARAVGPRVDEVAASIDAVAARIAEVEQHAAGEADLERLRMTLADRLGSLDELSSRIDELAARRDPATAGDPGTDAERAVVAGRVARLEQAVIELAEASPSIDQRALDDVADRLSLIERERAGADDLERIARAVEIVRGEVHDRLSSMAAELGGLDGRLRGLSARPALEPEAEVRVAGLEARVAEIARSVAAQAGGERRVAGSALTGDAAEDIERLRMSIERLGHTIGEQGRAIAELMKMRGGDDGLQRLTSRVEALEDGGVAGSPGGEGGAPSAGLGTLTRRVDDTDAALEKLLTQLERMGSSLEWRFRRLEEMVGGG